MHASTREVYGVRTTRATVVSAVYVSECGTVTEFKIVLFSAHPGKTSQCHYNITLPSQTTSHTSSHTKQHKQIPGQLNLLSPLLYG